MAVAAAVLAAVVAVWQRAQPAVAFDIVDLEGGVRVEVIDLITDPELATRQLEAAGLRATLTGVPVSEGLIGRVVAAGATGTATVAVTTDSTGVIVFDVVGLGSLNIEYGRRAIEGEESSGTNSVQCQAWRGQLIDDVRDDIERVVPVVRWHLFDTMATSLEDVAEPPAGTYVQDVMTLDLESVLIVLADVADALPTTGDCRAN